MAPGYNEEIRTSEQRSKKVLGHPPFEISLALAMRASVAGRNAGTRPPNKQLHGSIPPKSFPRIVPSPNFCQVSDTDRPLFNFLVCYDRRAYARESVIQDGESRNVMAS